MSQCVPSWDLVDQSLFPVCPSLPSHSNSTKPDVSLLDYEVAELTWGNGQVAMQGFGLPRLSMKPVSSNSPGKYAWEKPRPSGTLESLVNQATYAPPHYKALFSGGVKNEDLVPWFDQYRSGLASAALTTDALVPCSNPTDGPVEQVMDTSLVGSIDRVGSCSGAGTEEDDEFLPLKRARVARVPSSPEWSSRNQSVSISPTFEDTEHVSYDTYDEDLSVGFTSTSPENTIDDNDSIFHSRPQFKNRKRITREDDLKKKRNGKSSISNNRSRASSVHNQSERKRRDKINKRMKTLQKLVPNSSKTDKASMLDEVIEHLKQLQAQLQMMRMNMAAMMLPMAVMQQQLQMSMLQASMGVGPMIGATGMGLGMGIDMSLMGRSNISGVPPLLHPAGFMLVNPWTSSGDRLRPTPATMIPDPSSTFLPCQSQPINMDAYYRLAAMFQQFHQSPLSSSKN